MVSQMYTPELQLDKANASDTEASNLYLHLFISKEIASSKIMINAMTLILTKCLVFGLEGDVHRSTSYGIHVSY